MPAADANAVSETFDPSAWRVVAGFEDLTDITYHRHVVDGVDQPTVRVAFDRPEVRNAFRPHTVDELYRALDHARMTSSVGVVLLTGNGPSPKDGGWAFCSGGDQRIRGRSGYQYASGESADTIDPAQAGRLHILEVQRLIRFMPKVVVRRGAGVGRRRRALAARGVRPDDRVGRARAVQADRRRCGVLRRRVRLRLPRPPGRPEARAGDLLPRLEYSAEDAHRMGMVNAVVPHASLEATALDWAARINGKSPQAQRMLKFAFNLLDDGLVGQQVFAGEATRLAYMTDEAVEGRDAFLEKRDPDWSPYPHYF